MNADEILVAHQDGSMLDWGLGDLYAAELILKARYDYLLKEFPEPTFLICQEMSRLTTVIADLDMQFKLFRAFMLANHPEFYQGLSGTGIPMM